MAESLAREESLPAQTELVVGPLTLDLVRQKILWKNKPVQVGKTGYRVVHLLASREGKIVSHAEIHMAFRQSRLSLGKSQRTNIRVTILNIRKAFLKVDKDFVQLENLHSVGYRWRTPTSFVPSP